MVDLGPWVERRSGTVHPMLTHKIARNSRILNFNLALKIIMNKYIHIISFIYIFIYIHIYQDKHTDTFLLYFVGLIYSYFIFRHRVSRPPSVLMPQAPQMLGPGNNALETSSKIQPVLAKR